MGKQILTKELLGFFHKGAGVDIHIRRQGNVKHSGPHSLQSGLCVLSPASVI